MNELNQAASAAQACPDCSALVADLSAHEQWHARFVTDIARAVAAEIQRSR
jgi:hypothetical protein